jgi:hypothetical protein
MRSGARVGPVAARNYSDSNSLFEETLRLKLITFILTLPVSQYTICLSVIILLYSRG